MHIRILNIILFACLLIFPFRAIGQINTDQVIRVGQNALYFDDYVLSIQYFNQAIQAKPYLAQPYFLRAIAKLNLDDLPGAEADASKALSLNPFLPDAWEVRGVARQNMGNDSAAISDYEEALKLLPRNRQIMFNKAMAEIGLKRYEAADTTFKRLLSYYPKFDKGYLGRAKLLLERGDTAAAMSDLETTLEINPNSLNAYLLRAQLAIDRGQDYATALDDMNQAIKLEPKLSGLYINRAFLRYKLDDYFGAMADFDYSLELDPYNTTALFNRGLMLMEVGDNDKSLVDFTKVLQLEPDNYLARFNRSLVYNNKHDYDAAIADIDAILKDYPEFSDAYYLRSVFNKDKGNMKQAHADYEKGRKIAMRADVNDLPGAYSPDIASADVVSKKFNNLLTIDNDTKIQEEYNNTAIRGRVQDHDLAIEIMPMMELSFYSSPNELKESTYYIKEVDDLNATRLLRFVMMVVCNPPQLSIDQQVEQHFSSIEYYNTYIATHAPRAIDYLGRAMDYMTLRNYESALGDINKAIEIAPDQMVLYMLRAQARLLLRATETATYYKEKEDVVDLGKLKPAEQLALVVSDIDKAIDLSPRTAILWYNKGNAHFYLNDYTSAIAAYNKAIELQPNMGEAYYNRGYMYLKLGNQAAGTADLSKAGELGIVSAYNLIKRVNK